MTKLARGPSPEVRLAVKEREGGRCAACGAWLEGRWFSIQHRRARGTGGDNSIENLALLCGTSTSPDGCHLLCEQRTQEMHERGLWLYSWERSADVPVRLWTGDVVLLAGDGSYAPLAEAA